MQQTTWSSEIGDAAEPGNVSAASMIGEIRGILDASGWLVIDVDRLSDEDDLYAAGLTSHGSVNLMLALEDRFQVEFPDALLRRRTFESIAAIHAAVASLLSGTPSG